MQKNKSRIVVSIVILAIVASILISLLTALIRFGSWNMFDYSQEYIDGDLLEETQSFSVDEINSIEIDISQSHVIINYSDDDNVYLNTYNTKRLDVKTQLKNGTLSVNESSKRFWNWFSFGYNPTLEISIPKYYSESISADISAGSIKVKESFDLKKLTLTGSAGEIVIDSEIVCDKFEANISAGEIDIHSLTSKEYKISTSAGSIKISDLSGSGEVSASLGEIDAHISKIDKSASFSATAGEVKLTVDRSISFEFYGEKTLGDIKTDFKIYTDENGKYFGQHGDDDSAKLNVFVTTGDAKISLE